MTPLSHSARRIAAALAIALVAAPGVATADIAQADKHFKRGVELYKDSDYAAALVEFQRAYETQPSYQVLYNIGETQYQLQDWASAYKTFQRYLSEGNKRLSSKRRKEVEKEIEKLRQRVATLSIATSEAGAAVTIDDVSVGQTPLAEPILVSSGRRKITATLPGRPPVTEVLQLAGGDVKDLTLTIPLLPPPKVEVVTRESPSPVVPVTAWAGTGAVVVGAVVTGVLALGASSDLKERLVAYPADPKAISSAQSKAVGLAITTDVLTAVALAGAGVSVWLTVRHQRLVADSRAPAGPASPASPAARLVFFPSGVGVAGSF